MSTNIKQDVRVFECKHRLTGEILDVIRVRCTESPTNDRMAAEELFHTSTDYRFRDLLLVSERHDYK